MKLVSKGEKSLQSQTQTCYYSSLPVENKVDTLNQNQKVSNAFEDLKFFFPHLKNAGNIYPNVLIGKGRKNGKKFKEMKSLGMYFLSFKM